MIEGLILILITSYSHAYSLQDNDIVPFRDAKSERLQYFSGPNVFSGLSSFFFAYIGQHASFEVYASLKKPCYTKWEIVSNVAVVIAGMFSIMLCLSAWLNLGDSIEGNILDTFVSTNTPITICKAWLAVLMFMTYPMDFFVARQNLNRGLCVDCLGMPEYMPFWRFSLITFIVWTASVTVGKFTTSVRYFPIAITSLISAVFFFLQEFCFLILRL